MWLTCQSTSVITKHMSEHCVIILLHSLILYSVRMLVLQTWHIFLDNRSLQPTLQLSKFYAKSLKRVLFHCLTRSFEVLCGPVRSSVVLCGPVRCLVEPISTVRTAWFFALKKMKVT